MALPLPNSAHGDKAISAKCRGTALERLGDGDRTGWLGREDSNLRVRKLCADWAYPVVQRESGNRSCAGLPASACTICPLREASETQISDAEVRILPPQPASPVSIGCFAIRIGRPLGHLENVG